MTWLLLFLAYAVALTLALSRAGHRSQSPTAAGADTARTPMQRLLVIGATGGTGRQLLRQALERGMTVTALVRDPVRLDMSHARLTVIKGDVLDPVAVETAMAGQQGVLCALGHKRFWYPTRILSTGTANILAAMTKHGVRRLVCETSLGIGDSAGRMGLYYTLFVIPLILPFYFWDKTRQERLIAGSDSDWTLVRPAALTNGDARGPCRHGTRIGHYLLTRRIPRADVAAFMLDQLDSGTYLHSAPGITAAA